MICILGHQQNSTNHKPQTLDMPQTDESLAGEKDTLRGMQSSMNLGKSLKTGRSDTTD